MATSPSAAFRSLDSLECICSLLKTIVELLQEKNDHEKAVVRRLWPQIANSPSRSNAEQTLTLAQATQENLIRAEDIGDIQGTLDEYVERKRDIDMEAPMQVISFRITPQEPLKGDVLLPQH